MFEKYPNSTIRIDFQDCDPFGHLSNGKYIDYFHNARAEHLRDYYNLDIYEHTEETQNTWVVSKNKINYLIQVLFNKKVLIETQLIYADQRRIIFQGIMFSEHKEYIHAILWSEFIYININSGRPAKHEDSIRDLLGNIILNKYKNKKIDNYDFDKTVKEIKIEFKKNK
ncbi:MAG: acyl-CoA thioesterase [Spirochaetia bacterium]|nr:acyl-CoA thioesterase [Spirochaetia bacterium]